MLESARRPLRDRWLIWALLTCFVAAGMIRYWNADAEDLASSYVGCRLIEEGHADALFNYDPDNFAGIGPGAIWQQTAARGGFHGYLHPYVQTPLWGYALQPVCARTSFAAFSRVFLLLVMLCFAATVWLIARYWTPFLLQPFALAIVLLCFWFSQPFQYAMFLMQTHALFIFLAVASLILAERERPIAAGLLLACAAAVKVTPGVLILYWLLTRRWRAAVSLVLCSALLMMLTLLAVGPHLVEMYLADLHRISRVLLVSLNNQSFAAWLMGRFHPEDDLFDVDIFWLPTTVRLGSTVLLVLFTAAGGWIDRRSRTLSGSLALSEPPVGAVVALVAVTIFAPIAWTHYFVILVAPVMVLLEEARRLRTWWIAVVALLIVALNFRPLATNVIAMEYGKMSLVRGQFYAGALCLLTLSAVAWYRNSRDVQLAT